MAFLLYAARDQAHWELASTKADLKGSIARYARERLAQSPRHRLEWHAGDAELLTFLTQDSPKSSASMRLVVDVEPNSKSTVHLQQILDVWGVTTESWTPIALRLRCLWNEECLDPQEFKRKIEVKPSHVSGDIVHEFLYLYHPKGPEKGWNWGRVGFVNGALLWPDDLNYFIKEFAARTPGLLAL